MDDLVVSCPVCSKRFKVHPDRLPKGVSSFNCRKCGALINLRLPAEPVQPKEGTRTVLIVLDEVELAELIVKILSRGNFKSQIAATGAEALDVLGSDQPDAVIISVALPDMIGYELIDRIRRSDFGKTLPAVLLSSLHHGTRFKRAPTSFYGADDYIERHHLPDLLIPKLNNIFEKGTEAKPLDAASNISRSLSDDEIDERREIERLHEPPDKAADEHGDEEVRRMARVIAGDILLYNEDTIKGCSPQEAENALAGDIEEGKGVLASRFPDFSGNTADILTDEIRVVLRAAVVDPDKGDHDGS